MIDLGKPCIRCEKIPTIFNYCKNCIKDDHEYGWFFRCIQNKYLVMPIGIIAENVFLLFNIEEAFKELKEYGHIDNYLPNYKKISYPLVSRDLELATKEAEQIISLPDFEKRRLAARLK